MGFNPLHGSTVYIIFSLSTHWFIGTCFFYFLIIMDSVIINKAIKVSLWHADLS